MREGGLGFELEARRLQLSERLILGLGLPAALRLGRCWLILPISTLSGWTALASADSGWTARAIGAR